MHSIWYEQNVITEAYFCVTLKVTFESSINTSHNTIYKLI